MCVCMVWVQSSFFHIFSFVQFFFHFLLDYCLISFAILCNFSFNKQINYFSNFRRPTKNQGKKGKITFVRQRQNTNTTEVYSILILIKRLVEYAICFSDTHIHVVVFVFFFRSHFIATAQNCEQNYSSCCTFAKHTIFRTFTRLSIGGYPFNLLCSCVKRVWTIIFFLISTLQVPHIEYNYVDRLFFAFHSYAIPRVN